MTTKFKNGLEVLEFLKVPAPTADDQAATRASAQAQADAAQAAAEATAAADAQAKANTAEANAKTYADGVAATAQTNAEATAAADATAKADAAEANAIAAAAADATTKANAAEANAKTYADQIKSGILYKTAAKVGSGVNVDLAVAPGNIDGVALVAGDRVFLPTQTDPIQNGLYTVQADGLLARSTDADGNDEVKPGLYVFVSQGPTYGNTGWSLTTDDPIDVGVTALTFTQFNGTPDIDGGAGLTKTGNVLNVDIAPNRTVINANDQVDVDPDLLPSPVAGDAGKFLGADGADLASWKPLPQVNAAGQDGILTSVDYAKLDDILPVVFKGVVPDNQAVAAPIDASLNYDPATADGAIFDVVIKRGAGNVFVGRLLVANSADGASRSISLYGEEIGATGLTFSVDLSGGLIRLLATTTATGVAANVKLHRVLMLAS